MKLFLQWHSSLKLLMTLLVKLSLDITHLDVKIAFLNDHLKERLFMKQPERFISSDKSKEILRLKKV